jgi:sugar phosphate isomerase/epimerase
MSGTGVSDKPWLGFNMHPRWLRGGSPESFLLPLRQMGVSILEFKLDLTAPDWPQTEALIDFCRALGSRVSLHAPHKGPYNLTSFRGLERRRIQKHLGPVIDYAAAVAADQGPTTLVVHGAKGTDTREALRRDTEAFLSWIQERTADLHLALELRVREPNVTKIGDSKRELLTFVSQSRIPGLGICWDIGHDACNGAAAAPSGFIERATHVHVHDLSPQGEDHHPLLYGNAPYRSALQALRQVGYEGPLILEVNGHFVGRAAKEEGVPVADILRRSFRKIAEAFSA